MPMRFVKPSNDNSKLRASMDKQGWSDGRAIALLNGPKNGHSADTSKSPAGESQAGLCISC